MAEVRQLGSLEACGASCLGSNPSFGPFIAPFNTVLSPMKFDIGFRNKRLGFERGISCLAL